MKLHVIIWWDTDLESPMKVEFSANHRCLVDRQGALIKDSNLNKSIVAPEEIFTVEAATNNGLAHSLNKLFKSHTL